MVKEYSALVLIIEKDASSGHFACKKKASSLLLFYVQLWSSMRGEKEDNDVCKILLSSGR